MRADHFNGVVVYQRVHALPQIFQKQRLLADPAADRHTVQIQQDIHIVDLHRQRIGKIPQPFEHLCVSRIGLLKNPDPVVFLPVRSGVLCHRLCQPRRAAGDPPVAVQHLGLVLIGAHIAVLSRRKMTSPVERPV